jgi:hypothetical protein
LTISTTSGRNKKAAWGRYRSHLKSKQDASSEKQRKELDKQYAGEFGITSFDSERQKD